MDTSTKIGFGVVGALVVFGGWWFLRRSHYSELPAAVPASFPQPTCAQNQPPYQVWWANYQNVKQGDVFQGRTFTSIGAAADVVTSLAAQAGGICDKGSATGYPVDALFVRDACGHGYNYVKCAGIKR